MTPENAARRKKLIDMHFKFFRQEYTPEEGQQRQEDACMLISRILQFLNVEHDEILSSLMAVGIFRKIRDAEKEKNP